MISSPLTPQDHEFYKISKPFAYLYKDNFIHHDMALKIQSEILNITSENWDRYCNPFENKYTLRDKNKLPPYTALLFQELESPSFVGGLEVLCGKKLYTDTYRNFWGVHKFGQGDNLDIHLDAGLHPTTLQKKQLTLGIYLTTQNWTKENRGEIELWGEDDAGCISECVSSIEPVFNRMILFDNTNNSWHGSPHPIKCDSDQTRIFVTMSYMSDFKNLYHNYRTKAYFTPRPQDKWSEEKIMLRDLRCDPERYMEIYRKKKIIM